MADPAIQRRRAAVNAPPHPPRCKREGREDRQTHISYFRAWAGFHSDSSQSILSARRELALMML